MFSKIRRAYRIIKSANYLEKKLRDRPSLVVKGQTEIDCCGATLAIITEVHEFVNSLEIIVCVPMLHISETGHIDLVCPRCNSLHGFNGLKPLVEDHYQRACKTKH